MSTIWYKEPELVIALNRKVIFVNPNDLQIFKEVEIPDDLTTCGLKVTNNESSEINPKQQKNPKTKVVKEVPIIQNVKVSANRDLLAITTSGQKALLVYKNREEYAGLISVRPLSRASTAITFDNQSELLLVTDKTGDCYAYSCVELEEPPRLLLGHLSIVYDLLWTRDGKYIITCDRDDKIRVTNYPNTHDIHGYCLGHKEFVSGLALLKDDVFASVSGDKTLRLWNYESGKELAKAELPAPGIRFDVRNLDSGEFQVAVLLHQPNECCGIYECSADTLGKWKIRKVALLSFPEMIAGNLCFANSRLYVAGVVDERFILKLAEIANAEPPPENWLEMVVLQFKNEKWKLDDVSVWFKKRYDNVSDYLQRKKQRICEKNQK